jgi:hypothetical protein
MEECTKVPGVADDDRGQNREAHRQLRRPLAQAAAPEVEKSFRFGEIYTYTSFGDHWSL